MVWQHGLSIKTEGLPWQRDSKYCICDKSDEDAMLWINQMYKRGRGWGICRRVGEQLQRETLVQRCQKA